jgi:cystathionine beta-synthase
MAAPPAMQKPKIMNSILENVGLTPLIRLNKVHREDGVKCEICA